MKFKIINLKITKGNSKDTGKPWTLFKFKNAVDGFEYSAFSQAGYTDKFDNGYEFEADVTEKPNPKGGVYRNIQWPKAQTSNVGQSSGQLDRIEAKLDQIIQLAAITKVSIPKGVTPLKITKPNGLMPYEDSPPPDDKDFPGF